MRWVIFGLTITSSWGNGHATLWRGLLRALAARGHHATFFERDASYYAPHRDFFGEDGVEVRLYPDWPEVLSAARRAVAAADVVIVTSFCADAVAAAELALASRVPRRVFYDLDTPVTLARLEESGAVEWLGSRGLREFDLVLSYTGGEALNALRERLGAREVAPLYGWADPQTHRPVPPEPDFASDLSYLGTYAPDRQEALDRLLLEPARQLPGRRFLIGGSQYPRDFPWRDNLWYRQHVPPPLHAPFFCSSRLTLNLTRGAMAQLGWCPSGRLFEAALCGTPLVSDRWPGLEHFLEPGRQILVADRTEDVVEALGRDDEELRRLAAEARERVLDEHVAERRADELLRLLHRAPAGLPRRNGERPGAEPRLEG